MDLRQRIVEEARSWLGTPYHHQAMVKGAGVDCAMILVAVYRAVGLIPAGFDPRPYPQTGICTGMPNGIWATLPAFAAKWKRRRLAASRYGVSGGRFRTAASASAATKSFTATSGAGWCWTIWGRRNCRNAGCVILILRPPERAGFTRGRRIRKCSAQVRH